MNKTKDNVFSLTGVSFTKEKPSGFESHPLHYAKYRRVSLQYASWICFLTSLNFALKTSTDMHEIVHTDAYNCYEDSAVCFMP